MSTNLREERSRSLREERSRDNAVYRLLHNCVTILEKDATEYHRVEQVAINSHYSLADVLVPDAVTSLNTQCSNSPEMSDDEDEFPLNDDQFDDEDYNTSATNSDTDEPLPHSSLPVKTLRDKPKTGSGHSDRQAKQGPKLQERSWASRAQEALDQVVTGLCKLCARSESYFESPSKSSKFHEPEPEPKMAKPFEPIPMHFTPLNQQPCPPSTPTKQLVLQEASNNVQSSWRERQLAMYLEKAAQLFYLFAEQFYLDKHGERSIFYVRNGLTCCEAVTKLHNRQEPINIHKWIALLVSLAADVHLARPATNCDGTVTQDDMRLEQKLFDALNTLYVGLEDEFSWCCVTQFDESAEERFKLASRCFETALAEMKKCSKCTSTTQIERQITLKFGNVSNELGSLYMNQAVSTFAESTPGVEMYTRLEVLTKKSLAAYVKAIQAFDSARDAVNCGLLYSNCGKLMRCCAHVFAPIDVNKQRCQEVSGKTRVLEIVHIA